MDKTQNTLVQNFAEQLANKSEQQLKDDAITLFLARIKTPDDVTALAQFMERIEQFTKPEIEEYWVSILQQTLENQNEDI
jgi:hypothetical protein